MTTTIKFTLMFLALSLAATSLACPTRTISTADGGGSGGADGSDTQTGGHGGSFQADAGGTAGVGGASGVAGMGGSALAGTNGAAGAVGTGGMAGAGGVAGAGGTGGLAGGTGSGGSSPTCAPTCSSATQTCVGTKCLLNDGQACALASQCASTACTPFYVDQDSDGYGTGPAVGFCGTTPPVGYAAQTGDCCDTASNLALAKLIHPNAGFQTASAGGVCGVSWDYDCDGTIETSKSAGQCGPDSVYPTCTPVFMNFAESDCGTPQASYTCSPEIIGGTNACVGGSLADGGPLGCR